MSTCGPSFQVLWLYQSGASPLRDASPEETPVDGVSLLGRELALSQSHVEPFRLFSWIIGGKFDGRVRGAWSPENGVTCRCATWAEHVNNNMCLVSELPGAVFPDVLLTPDGQWHDVHRLRGSVQTPPLAELIAAYRDTVVVGIDACVPGPLVAATLATEPDAWWRDAALSESDILSSLTHHGPFSSSDNLPQRYPCHATPMYLDCACPYHLGEQQESCRSLTAQEWLEAWLRNLEAHCSRSLKSRAERAIHHFLGWSEGQVGQTMTVTQLTPSLLTRYSLCFRDQDHASTVRMQFLFLQAWCDWLTRAKALPANPAAHLKLLEPQPWDEPRALNTDQLQHLFHAARQTNTPARDVALLQMLSETGMRVQECAALCWGDVQLGRPYGQVWIQGRTLAQSRKLLFSPTVCQALVCYAAPLLEVESTFEAVVSAWLDLPPDFQLAHLWRNQHNQPLRTSDISRIIAAISRNACGNRRLTATFTVSCLRYTIARNYLAHAPGDVSGLAAFVGVSLQTAKRLTVELWMQQCAEELQWFARTSSSSNVNLDL